MRNPIRLKNLRARFVPYYLIGLAILVFFPAEPTGFVLAVPFIVLGLALRGWGAGHLVKNDVLTMSGPYAHLRHPLYAGTLLLATGFATLIGGPIAIGMVLAIWPWFGLSYFPRKERIESERLEGLYGETYAAYRRAVPALWPRWQAWVPVSSESLKTSAFEQIAANELSPARWELERYSNNNELGTMIAVLSGVAVVVLRVLWGIG